ncbi:integral membrane protein [alpha proteobacterium U9-1i]|nr:integral membrane protein [alpha proteobacterium U9-1i]
MTTQTLAGYSALALLAGVLIPIMAALSGALGRTLDSPQSASLIVVGGAFAMVLAFTLLSGGANFSLAQLKQASALQLVAGFGMAFYLLSITYLAPRFGVGNAVMLVVAGQIVSSALIDHFGLFGAPHKPIDAMRALGLAVMTAGVVIAQVAANNTRPVD